MPRHGAFVQTWLANGNAAGMGYIERGMAKRLQPSLVLSGVRSIVTVAYPYAPPPPPPAIADWRETLQGRIAAYALGTDYHDVVLSRLDGLARDVHSLAPGCRSLTYVDTGPILERDFAHNAGVGWFGKNTMILHPHHGSWFFLGEILTDLDLGSEPLVPDHCGTCRRCLDLCPTGALADGYRLDARLCISYLTIEHRGPLPLELRPKIGNWIFGCDVCQEVCPWNEKTGDPPASEPDLTPRLPDILALSEETFRARFRRSAVWRAKRAGLLRNAAVALGNTGNPSALPALARAVQEDSSPLVRAHAAWAIGRIPSGRGLTPLERARRDPDTLVREEATRALDERTYVF